MSKHTPGPWSVGSNNHGAECINVWMGIVHIAAVMKWLPPKQDPEANARLISAAPKLLEALQNLMETCEYGDHNADEYNAAVAAIAKATGEQP